MASAGGKTTSRRRYFYLNGDLHEHLGVERKLNLLYARRVRDSERVTYLLSDVRKNSQRAFYPPQAAELLGITKRSLKRFILEGLIKKPDSNGEEKWQARRYLYSEDDVLAVFDMMSQMHHGPPRKDGRVTPWKGLPSRAELIAKMRGEEILYYKDEDGNFRPVWKEPEW